jgi:hypothetical protein
VETGIELKRETGPHTPDQQAAADFAKSLGLKALFARFPADGGFRGLSAPKTVILDANQTLTEKIWYIAGHEIAHSAGFDTSLKVDDATAEYWLAKYKSTLDPASNYFTYLANHPENRRREGVAHLVGHFLSNASFRNELELSERPLWNRIVRAVLNVFGRDKPPQLPAEAWQVLKALRARRKQVRAQATKRKGSRTP